MEFCGFCLCKLSPFPHFVVSTIQVLLESMLPAIECSVHSDKTLLYSFYRLFTDYFCLLIVVYLFAY